MGAQVIWDPKPYGSLRHVEAPACLWAPKWGLAPASLCRSAKNVQKLPKKANKKQLDKWLTYRSQKNSDCPVPSHPVLRPVVDFDRNTLYKLILIQLFYPLKFTCVPLAKKLSFNALAICHLTLESPLWPLTYKFIWFPVRKACVWSGPKPSLKIGTAKRAICWNYLGLFRDYGLNHIRNKTFLMIGSGNL